MLSNVAIIIPVMNRIEFIERQLRYYAAVHCPHPIYIADGSTGEYQDKMTSLARHMQESLTVHLFNEPHTPIDVSIAHALERVREPYACIIGDDDFQIPNSLTLCADFLATHLEYASAHGHAITLRIQDNGVYGTITKIKDYPQPEYTAPTASERLLQFFSRYYVSLFSVARTKDMMTYWQHAGTISDVPFGCEILPCALALIRGKSKLIDCLGFVRQIHDRHKPVPNNFDWIIESQFSASYHAFERISTKALTVQNPIDFDQASKIVRQAFWLFLQKQLSNDYQILYGATSARPPSPRAYLAQRLPWLKSAYNIIKPYIKKRLPLHAAVTQAGSLYYQDFQRLKTFIEPVRPFGRSLPPGSTKAALTCGVVSPAKPNAVPHLPEG
ncbi:MAG: TIGR00180 family glycosyltransferase [Patescibacteria group bacterium]